MNKDNKVIKTFSEFCEEQTCCSCPFYAIDIQCEELYKKAISQNGKLKININISKEIYKPRKIKIPAVYKHFKHKEDGIINNYLYCTMFLAYPIREEDELNTEIMRKAPKITAKHTETNEEITLFYYDNKWNYINERKETLVIYKSLYDGNFPYARPMDMFLSEVDHNKYQNVKQKYKFELLDGEE